MSTVSGKLLLNSTTAPLANVAIRFTPVSYPLTESGVGVWSGAAFEVVTDDEGDLAIELPPQLYAVQWRVRGIVNRGYALVPDEDIRLEDILVPVMAWGEPNDGTGAIEENLMRWTNSEQYQMLATEYNASGIVNSATVLWPDKSIGTFRVLQHNPAHLAPDSFELTHPKSGRRVIQPTVTRDHHGNVVSKPEIVIVR